MPSAKVGDILSRPDGRRIRLAGVMAGEFVAEPLDEHGTPFRVTAAELLAYDGVTDPTIPSENTEREIMIRSDARASAEANRAYGSSHSESRRARRRKQELAKLGRTEEFPPPGSPEATLKAAAEVSDDDA